MGDIGGTVCVYTGLNKLTDLTRGAMIEISIIKLRNVLVSSQLNFSIIGTINLFFDFAFLYKEKYAYDLVLRQYTRQIF